MSHEASKTVPHAIKSVSPLRHLFSLNDRLKSVFERHHSRVIILLQLEGIGNHLDGPAALLRFRPHFEAQPEPAGTFSIDAESIH